LVSHRVRTGARAPLLTARLVALTTGLVALLALARTPCALITLAAACAIPEVFVLGLLAERIVRALVALLLRTAHRLAEVVHLRRHLLLLRLLALILIDATGLA